MYSKKHCELSMLFWLIWSLLNLLDEFSDHCKLCVAPRTGPSSTADKLFELSDFLTKVYRLKELNILQVQITLVN